MILNFTAGDTKFRLSGKVLGLIVFLPILLILSSFVFGATSHLTFTVVGNATNNSLEDAVDFNWNMSVDKQNVTACSMVIGLSNGTYFNQTGKGFNISMANSSATTGWWNASVITMVESDNASWHNFTYYCNISGAYNESSGPYRIKVDTTDPIAGWSNYTRVNNTLGSFINVSANVEENNTDTARVRVYLEDGTSTWYVLGIDENNATTERNASYFKMFNGTELSQEGDFILEYYVNDSFGKTDYSGNNETGLVSILTANQWSYVTITTDNLTYLRNITDTFPDVTHVSYFNNTYGRKNYTTYARSTLTINNETNISLGKTVAIYTTKKDYYIRKNYLNTTPTLQDSKTNETLYVGISNCSSGSTFIGATPRRGDCEFTGGTNKTAWNLISLYKDRTMNETLYACFNGSVSPSEKCLDPALSGVDIGMPFTEANFTYVSYWNASTGYMVTCKLGWSICTGTTLNVTSIGLKKSTGIWVLPSVNMTINRTAIAV